MRGANAAIFRVLAMAAIGLLMAVRALAGGSAVGIEPGDDGPPTLFQAQEVTVDRDAETVTARGEVEISRGERILMADEVAYDRARDVLTARGDVSLLLASGEVMFAEEMKVTGDLEEAAARSFRMLLTDRSRAAAASAVRVDDRITEMRKVVYSPCRRCVSGPNDTPFWQLKADTVVHDQQKKTLTYRDARLEILGVPLVYTPYLQHPAPDKPRASGLLAPNFEVSGELGTRVDVPYHFAISKHRDLTLTPIITTEEGPALAARYRQRTKRGRFSIAGSATVADRDTGSGQEDDIFRGHLDTEGQFHINREWRWGFDARVASDDTFLRVYDFGSDRFLESEAFLERFEGASYFSARAIGFQGTRQRDDDEELPIVGPELRFSTLDRDSVLGGRSFLDASAVAISRLDGRDSRRLSSTVGWQRAFTDALGGTAEITTALYADAYQTDGVAPGNPDVNPGPALAQGGDVAGRLYPQAAASYRLPFTRTSFLGREVLTPRAQVVVGPNAANDGAIPNEDSRDFTFDTTNLFQLNRFPGRDRVSTGQRIDYGLDYTLYRDGGGSLFSTVIGQSYRLNGDSDTPESVGGADGDLSDIVGRTNLRPHPGIDLSYRYRLDDDSLNMRRSEVGLSAGAPAFNVDLAYTLLESETTAGTSSFGDREELFVDVSSRIARDWSVRALHRQDLESGTALSTEAGVSYHCDCFRFDFFVEREDFRDRGIDPETSVKFRFVFEHLGAVGSSP
ncbi:LPS-assembly protein LptD [Limimonas halophila]|nr:LPS assembly protein LptD [Limimonas halophila]